MLKEVLNGESNNSERIAIAATIIGGCTLAAASLILEMVDAINVIDFSQDVILGMFLTGVASGAIGFKITINSLRRDINSE